MLAPVVPDLNTPSLELADMGHKKLETLDARKEGAAVDEIKRTNSPDLKSVGDDCDVCTTRHTRGAIPNHQTDAKRNQLLSKNDRISRRKSREYPNTPSFAASIASAVDKAADAGNSDCAFRGTKISGGEVSVSVIAAEGAAKVSRQMKGLTRAEQRLYAAANPAGYAVWLFLALALLSTALVFAAAAAADPVVQRLWLPGAMPPGPSSADSPLWAGAGSLPVRGRHGPAIAAAVRQGLLLRLLHRLLPEAVATARGTPVGRAAPAGPAGPAAASAAAGPPRAEARQGAWFPAAHVQVGPGPQQSRW
jgi:hypothetical protein